MTLRRSVWAITSIGLAIALTVLLIRVSKIDLRVTLQQLKSVSFITFAKLILLNGMLVYLSSEKWRSIDAVWRRSSDSVLSRTTSLALTSSGLALGMILPVQLAMSASRTLGTFAYGRPLKRGAVGTLLEQGFDLLIVAFLAAASAVTWIYKGGGAVWAVSAAVMTMLALLAAEPTILLIRRLAGSYNVRSVAPRNRILRSLWELQHSDLLNARLARRLMILSVVRFGLVVLMSIQTAEAIGLHIPLWRMAAAIPFVGLASLVALTPGGIGVNELTSVTALMFFGIPLAVSAPWALTNRVLVAVSYLVVATCFAALLGVERIIALRTSGAMAVPTVPR